MNIQAVLNDVYSQIVGEYGRIAPYFPSALVVGVIVGIIVLILRLHHHKSIGVSFTTGLLAAYTFLVYERVLSSFRYYGIAKAIHTIPFQTLHSLYKTVQFGLNIILFIPIGFLLPMVVYQLRNVRMRAWQMGLVAMVISISIEATQYLLSIGEAETDDVITNTLGAVIGFLLYKGFEKIMRRIRGEWEQMKE